MKTLALNYQVEIIVMTRQPGQSGINLAPLHLCLAQTLSLIVSLLALALLFDRYLFALIRYRRWLGRYVDLTLAGWADALCLTIQALNAPFSLSGWRADLALAWMALRAFGGRETACAA